MNEPLEEKTHLTDFAKIFIGEIADEYMADYQSSFWELSFTDRIVYLIEKEYIILDHEDEE